MTARRPGGVRLRVEPPAPAAAGAVVGVVGDVRRQVRDPRGRLVGFGGRSLQKDAQAKYLNSPETPVFHKGSLLYRFPEARKAAAKAKAL